jgi:hypothetical protein
MLRFQTIAFYLSILFSFFLSASIYAGEQQALLVVKPVSDNFFETALPGNDPLLDKPGEIRFTGTVNNPSFLINNISQITVTLPGGEAVPLLIDRSSVYSEFDESEINSLRISFVIYPSKLKSGSMLLKWGADVKAENKEVEKFEYYLADRGRYRTFTLEERPKGDKGGEYFATLEVIVDDYADTYYIWYLLPMFLIFVLLFIRKAFLK